MSFGPFVDRAILIVHVDQALRVLGNMLACAGWTPCAGHVQVVANEVIVD